jgi:hypothetical protein
MADIATNTLAIKDGAGADSSLAAQSSSYGLVPVHAISGSVNITSSANSPVLVTGSVAILQPVNVDITVADNISVTSSAANPLFISSSANSPVLVTGSVLLLNNSSLTASISGTPTVTLSSNAVTASISGTPTITGTVNINNTSLSVTSSINNSSLNVTASINNSSLTITASNISPIATIYKKSSTTSFATKTVHNSYTTGDYYIDYTSSASGTFLIADGDNDRSTLIIFNPSSYNLYINVGSSSEGPNGFQMYNTSSAPLKYSFILFPSGTYMADETTLNCRHGGFFISKSEGGFSPEAVSTRINY